MISASVQIEDKDKANWEKLMKELKVGAAFVTVGVHEGAGNYTKGKSPPSVAEVALWNEFGTERIPERSFLRSTVDENLSRVEGWFAQAYDSIIGSIANGGDGKAAMFKALQKIGIQVQFLIQNKIKSNVPPPSSKATIAAKERAHSTHPNHTLMDTELLLRSISNEVTVE